MFMYTVNVNVPFMFKNMLLFIYMFVLVNMDHVKFHLHVHSTYTVLNGVFHEFYVTPLHGPKNLKMMTDVPFYVSKYIF